MKELIENIEKEYNVKVIYLTISGSKLYGTDNPNSDTDYKGIFIPNKLDVLLKRDISHIDKSSNKTNIKNSKDDVDISLHSIHTFLNLLKKSETGAVDLLFSMWSEETIVFQNCDIINHIKSFYKKILNKNMKSFIGYALGQTKKFGIKGARYNELDNFVKFIKTIDSSNEPILGEYFELFEDEIFRSNYKYIKFIDAPGPRGAGDYKDIKYISVLGKMFEGRVTFEYFLERVLKLYNQFGNRTKTVAETTEKVDFKSLSHALRVALEVEELLETGFINFPLKDREYIKDVKSGKVSPEVAIQKVEDVLQNVDEILLVTEMREESDQETLDEITLFCFTIIHEGYIYKN